jgi:hypothetical protein
MLFQSKTNMERLLRYSQNEECITVLTIFAIDLDRWALHSQNSTALITISWVAIK